MENILFATGNRSKLAQLQFVAQFHNIPLTIENGKEYYGEDASYAEDGKQIEHIALSGAREVAERLGRPVITEDSGFWVEALDSKPGADAKYYLKEYGRDGILQELGATTHRTAMIASAVAYADPNEHEYVFSYYIEGTISHKEQRDTSLPSWISPSSEKPFDGGFNAIFIPKNETRTLAQIPPEEAIPWSYRERTFTDVLSVLAS